VKRLQSHSQGDAESGCVSVWFLTFGTNDIPHHIIISYCISHHTSFCIIKEKYVEIKGSCPFERIDQIMKGNTTTQDMLSADISFYTKLIFISSDIRRIFFFAKHEKKGRCFSPTAKKRYVQRFHASQRNILH
jgi:hypothetical protein